MIKNTINEGTFLRCHLLCQLLAILVFLIKNGHQWVGIRGQIFALLILSLRFMVILLIFRLFAKI